MRHGAIEAWNRGEMDRVFENMRPIKVTRLVLWGDQGRGLAELGLSA
jgi:hypothetical protein